MPSLATVGAPSVGWLRMDLEPVFAAQPWHYWIAVPLAAAGVLGVVATVAGYLKKVQALKYPKGERG